MGPRVRFLGFLVAAALLAGCATHEWSLSGTLQPAAQHAGLPLTLFRARVQMSTLEVWGRARHGDGDYVRGFDRELDGMAALCAALARDELTFREDWLRMAVQLTTEYGSQWRWRNTVGWTRIRIDREALLAAARAASPADECRRRWEVLVVKVGPPDYEPEEWRQAPSAQ